MTDIPQINIILPQKCHCGNELRVVAYDHDNVRFDFCDECNDFRCDIDPDALLKCMNRSIANAIED